MQSGCTYTSSQVTNQVSVGTNINTVPIPVVRVGKVAPPFMMFGSKDNIYKERDERNNKALKHACTANVSCCMHGSYR